MVLIKALISEAQEKGVFSTLAVAKMSARIMKSSSYSNWVNRIGSILPAKVILYFKKLGLKRTTKAANALTLKDYNGKNR